MSVNPVADNFLTFASTRMSLSQQEISRCLDKLSEEQMWHRGGDHENSIANLLLHLAGNMPVDTARYRQPAGHPPAR